MNSSIDCNTIRRLKGTTINVTIPANSWVTGTADISSIINQYGYVGIEAMETDGANFWNGLIGYASISGTTLYYKVGNSSTVEKTIGIIPNYIVAHPKSN